MLSSIPQIKNNPKFQCKRPMKNKLPLNKPKTHRNEQKIGNCNQKKKG